jgi:mRNA-degrading endonuclease RelE of RelBE toxin-antitoxin system
MFKIKYHKLVLSEDFKRLPIADVKRIVKTVDKKLSLAPEIFGKKLSGNLQRFYRLRLDPYRIVYCINKREITVLVVCIGLRKDLTVYLEMAKRLRLFE